MDKFELMKKFMSTFVGNGFHLIIRENGNSFRVHTIEIMEKVDETCPVKDISIGDYFLHLVATNQQGEEASMVCDWGQELLENLLENYKTALEIGQTQIVMFRDPVSNDPNSWMLAWGDLEQHKTRQHAQTTYIS